MAIQIEVLGTTSCPHLEGTLTRVGKVVGSLAPGTPVEQRIIAGISEARMTSFPGSPTVRVNGVDVEGASPGPPALACRLYGREGLPPRWMLEAAVLRAHDPRHVLFLCVANSARSQLAEGIARSLAPASVRVASAGSAPSQLRPEAVQALAEIGIDASGQRAKGVEEVEGDVDLVITLCAEEACPLWLRPTRKVHWALPDPAAVKGESAREETFRGVRDELVRRLGLLFAPVA
jgi:arsenate reductase